MIWQSQIQQNLRIQFFLRNRKRKIISSRTYIPSRLVCICQYYRCGFEMNVLKFRTLTGDVDIRLRHRKNQHHTKPQHQEKNVDC